MYLAVVNGISCYSCSTRPVERKALNPIQDGPFRGCPQIGRGKKTPVPKICHRYPIMMKLNPVILYPKKIQKIYESRDTPLEFC